MPGVVTTWTGVTVTSSGALPAQVPITAISKANPAVISTTNTTGVVAGSYLLLNVAGMSQLSGKVVRVASIVASTSITLDAVDSTNFGTFTIGGYQIAAVTTNTLATLTSISASGGEAEDIDTTFLIDTVKSSIPGLVSAIKYTMESTWDATDAGLIAANASSELKDKRAYMIQFMNGTRLVFAGYINAPLIPGGSTGQKVTTALSINVSGGQKFYAT